jgi:hypothetical protein
MAITQRLLLPPPTGPSAPIACHAQQQHVFSLHTLMLQAIPIITTRNLALRLQQQQYMWLCVVWNCAAVACNFDLKHLRGELARR